MSAARYAVLVLTLVALGLLTVWGHLRLLSAGYELNERRSRRDRIDEEARVLGRRIDALATPSVAAARVRSLGLDLAPPPAGQYAEPAGERQRNGPGSASALVRAPDPPAGGEAPR